MTSTGEPHPNPHQQGTPLALIKPPKKIGEMTAEQRRAFADQIFEGLARAVKPAE